VGAWIEGRIGAGSNAAAGRTKPAAAAGVAEYTSHRRHQDRNRSSLAYEGASSSASAPWRQPDSIFSESLSAMSRSGASVPGCPARALSQSPPTTSAETRSR
jgi:hypothetical protein